MKVNKAGREEGQWRAYRWGCLVLPGGQYRQLVAEEALGPART